MKSVKWQNGNAEIEIFDDGTRIIKSDDDILKLEYPLNIDIRVSERCSFGMKKNGKAACHFCHESATFDGKDAEFDSLYNKLINLPRGVELAIGANQITDDLVSFLEKAYQKGWIANLTVNQGHLTRDISMIDFLMNMNLIKGLGISYRKNMKEIPEKLSKKNNVVIHVIAGIDDFDDVYNLNAKKILILGEKDFGFNKNKVDLNSKSHVKWYRNVSKLFKKFEIVSFDNLALEQLKIRRFFLDKNWDMLYQGEHSFYMNAVDQAFSRSSRSSEKVSWSLISLKDYFASINRDENAVTSE